MLREYRIAHERTSLSLSFWLLTSTFVGRWFFKKGGGCGRCA